MGERRTESAPSCRDVPPDQWVADCWDDMRRRWSRGDQVHVEEYLPPDYRHRLPAEAVVDLIYGEYVLSKEYEVVIDQRAFVHRFPDLEAALQRQFAVDDALSSDLPIDQQSTWPGSSRDPLGPSEPIPERIGKYVVVARIGLGGQAEIYRAVHPTLGKEVVLKLARETGGVGAAERERLEAEARILARIEHPNLARIYDLDFHNDRPFLVMEFIRGRTLEQYMRQEQPSPEESAALVAKIAQGVAVAHRCGIAHLDIKPSNVLVDDGGEPRLIDFGLAHLEDAWHEEVLEPDSLRGTLYFMAPEQACGSASEIDYRCDIFALGGLLFFLLTGESPYPKDIRFNELLRCVRASDWDQERLYRRHISPALRAVCLRAMHAQPAARYPNAAALAKRLELVARHARWQARAGWAAIAVVLALVCGALVWAAVEARSETPETATESKPAPVAANLTVQVWDVDRFRELTSVAPVRTENNLRIAAQIPAHMHYTLILLSSEGQLEELARGETGDTPADAVFPRVGKALPVTGPPGTEVIMICGRASKPLGVEELRRIWPDSGQLPQLPEMSVLRGGPQGVEVEQRGRGLGSPVDLPDPETVVRERLESLCKALRSHAGLFEAVAFCHQ